jgi:predicted Zn-dependent protease
MRRALLGLAAGALLVALALFLREPAPVEGPVDIPLGETVRQVMPGPDGEPEVWTLSKREGSIEPPAVLPAPEPRETPPDDRTDSARALDAQALEAWKHGDILSAIEYFEAAVEQDPDDWLPRADYGRLLVMMTNYAEAGPQLERAAELNPDDPRVWLDLHSYYERTLKLEQSLEARARAEELAAGRAIVQDRSGLWRLEDDSIFP